MLFFFNCRRRLSPGEYSSYQFASKTTKSLTITHSIMSFLSGKKRPRSDDVIFDLLTQNETAIESMRHAIKKCSIEEACSSLLDLKSIQFSALAKLREANTGLEETRSQLNKQSNLFKSLEYEEAHLQQQLSRQVPTPHLERMCREETQYYK